LSAQVRQSKEQLGQTRIQVDAIRDQIREELVRPGRNWMGSSQQFLPIATVFAPVGLRLMDAFRRILSGQVTTLDVLNSRAIMIDFQTNLILAERDVVVAAYAVKVALSRLNAATLGLQVVRYAPLEHYETCPRTNGLGSVRRAVVKILTIKKQCH